MNSGYAKEWRTGLQSKIGVNQKLNFITEVLSARANVSFDFSSSNFIHKDHIIQAGFLQPNSIFFECILKLTVSPN
jgi:hypothetical protein